MGLPFLPTKKKQKCDTNYIIPTFLLKLNPNKTMAPLSTLLPKSLSPPEIVVALLFMVFIVFPMPIPYPLNDFVLSPLGLMSLFGITVILFVVVRSPLLGVLFVFVAYEMIRRSQGLLHHRRNQVANPHPNQYVPETPYAPVVHQPAPNEVVIDRSVHLVPPVTTLEEDIVSKMAPLAQGDPLQTGDYQPLTPQSLADATLYA